MKKNILFLFVIMMATLLFLIVNEDSLQAGDTSSSHTVDELGWHRGEIPMEAMQPKNSSSISNDWSGDVSSLNNHVAGEMFKTATELAGCSRNQLITTFANQMRAGSGPWLGAGLTLFDLITKLNTTAQVGRGEASPEKLKDIIPHVVQAWEKIRGPENLPFGSSMAPIANYKDLGSMKFQEFGQVKMDQKFFTTAPLEIGRYGFDPNTDTSMRQITSSSVKNQTIQGMQPMSPNICNSPKIYTNPQAYTPTQSYTPTQVYTPTQSYIPSRK